MIKTPQFWYKSSLLNKIVSATLLPLSFFFILFSFIRKVRTKTHHLRGKTVICIGNIIAGGAGKTPIAIALCGQLKSMHNVCFLSKGYGRKTYGFLKVDHTMDASITGDEPQLLQKHAQAYLYSKVEDILENINQISEDVIIMDDGLQNNSIHKNCSILVLDNRMFGNGYIIPAGPLRERVISVLKKTHYIISTSSSPTPLPHTIYYVKNITSSSLKPQNVVAFSGIGDNTKFLHSLKQDGFNVIKFFDFPDHHAYSEREIKKIQAFAQTRNVEIITTEKDFVKLSYSAKHNIHVLKLEIHLDASLVEKINHHCKTKKQ